MKITPLLTLLTLLACAQTKTDRQVGGQCEDCDLMFDGIPSQINSSTSIAPAGEAGEKLIITGTIYKSDGKTPAPGVILYVYHTNAQGEYAVTEGQQHALQHGHLRGWVKTDAKGQYSFTTIRPASYPNRQAPQHIHPIIKEPGLSFYWIDEYLFEDDPLLTQTERARQEKRGGSGIIYLTKNEQGHWIGKRNIVLGLNIPNY